VKSAYGEGLRNYIQGVEAYRICDTGTARSAIAVARCTKNRWERFVIVPRVRQLASLPDQASPPCTQERIVEKKNNTLRSKSSGMVGTTIHSCSNDSLHLDRFPLRPCHPSFRSHSDMRERSSVPPSIYMHPHNTTCSKVPTRPRAQSLAVLSRGAPPNPQCCSWPAPPRRSE